MLYMTVSAFAAFFFLNGLVALQLLQLARIGLDWPSLLFVNANAAALGALTLFARPAPLLVKQGYLVAIAVGTAYAFTWIPAWSTWTLLLAMALYDVFAGARAAVAAAGPLPLLFLRTVERGVGPYFKGSVDEPVRVGGRAGGTRRHQRAAWAQPPRSPRHLGPLSLEHVARNLGAVLSPWGPLKELVELAEERGQAIPALVYSARPTARSFTSVVSARAGDGSRRGNARRRDGLGPLTGLQALRGEHPAWVWRGTAGSRPRATPSDVARAPRRSRRGGTPRLLCALRGRVLVLPVCHCAPALAASPLPEGCGRPTRRVVAMSLDAAVSFSPSFSPSSPRPLPLETVQS